MAARVDVAKGWPNISENNDYKRVGVRVDVAANSTTTVSWYGYAGNEPGLSGGSLNGSACCRGSEIG